MNIEEFFINNNIPTYSKTGIGVWTVDTSLFDADNPLFISSHILLLVRSGVLKVKMHGEEYDLTAGNYLDVLKNGGLQFISAVEHTDAVCLMFSEEYLLTSFKYHPPMSMAYVEYLKNNIVLKLYEPGITTLSMLFDSFNDTLSYTEHCNKNLIIQMKFKIFFLEISNIFKAVVKNEINQSNTSRRQFIFSSLIKLLVQYAKSEHFVDFYADKLCITPQYLGRIVHSFSKTTVYNIIANAVVSEIELKLDDLSLPLKQIAIDMNFSDQTSFTKYYKRHTGITPMQYRSMICEMK